MSLKYNIPYNKVAMKINTIDQKLKTDDHPTKDQTTTITDGEKHKDKYYEIPKLLDGFRLLNSALSEDPDNVYSVDVSRQDLQFVLEDDLKMFTRLETVKAGENKLPFSQFGAFASLRKLVIPCNEILFLDLEVEGRFDYLEYLDISYNSLDISAIAVLASLPSLKYLDLTRNGISRFPSVIKTMQRWKDYVIERLLPRQVAALDDSSFALETKKESNAFLSQDVYGSKRSFKSAVCISRSKSRLSITADQKEEIKLAESRVSSVVQRLANLISKTGFPELQTLVLEGNNISSSDIFDTLGILPNLISLNLNRNMLMALNALIPKGYNGPTDVLNDDPKKLIKYNGFLKLEELSLKFNRIPQMDNLMGLLCLPRIKNVYLEGNSVLKYCTYSRAAAKEDDPFHIFHSLYKINIADLPNKANEGLNLGTKYAVTSTKYGMTVVKKTHKKEIPHFIGQILRKAAVRGSHLVSPHKVNQNQDSLTDLAIRQIRRTYSFNEDDISNIIRMGQIPKIRDLKIFGETRRKMEKEIDDPVKIGAKEMLYDAEKQDSTFITGVHIAEDDEQASVSESDEESSEGDDDSEGEREFRAHYPLALSVQIAVKSLRHALLNPTSYWRVLEDSYVRPTAASLNRKVYQQPLSDFSATATQEDNLQDQFNDLLETETIQDQVKGGSRSSFRATPANTIVTPNNQNDFPITDGIDYKNQAANNNDPISIHQTITSAIANTQLVEGQFNKKAGKISFKRIRNKPPLDSKNKDELMNLKLMMNSVENRITKIELDLSSVLKFSELQKKLPQSKKLLKEIKEEYSKLQNDLLDEAKAKFEEDAQTGFKNVEEEVELTF